MEKLTAVDCRRERRCWYKKQVVRSFLRKASFVVTVFRYGIYWLPEKYITSINDKKLFFCSTIPALTKMLKTTKLIL